MLDLRRSVTDGLLRTDVEMGLWMKHAGVVAKKYAAPILR
jgi:hypothetical protein